MTRRPVDDVLDLRAHDLPPYWDGLAVVWDDWEDSREGWVITCPPPKGPQGCSRCGSTVPRESARGFVATIPEVTHDQIRDRELARGRLPEVLKHHPKRLAWLRLHAMRCSDCGLDTVLDLGVGGVGGDAWDLDETDYGDAGSNPPDTTRAEPARSVPKPTRAESIREARNAIRASRNETLF